MGAQVSFRCPCRRLNWLPLIKAATCYLFLPLYQSFRFIASRENSNQTTPVATLTYILDPLSGGKVGLLSTSPNLGYTRPLNQLLLTSSFRL